jgi:Tfp pilus assembly protein PilF
MRTSLLAVALFVLFFPLTLGALRGYTPAPGQVVHLAAEHVSLGFQFAQLGDGNLALEHTRAALRIDPDFAPAHFNLGIYLQQLGQLPAAEQSFQEVLRIEPTNQSAHLNLGNLLATQQRYKDAAQHYLAAPDLPAARENLELIRPHLPQAQLPQAPRTP